MSFRNRVAVLLLTLGLGLPAFAAAAPAGLEDVPVQMLRQGVLSDRDGKFEIGIVDPDIHWYRSTQAKYPTYAAVNSTARRVYTVSYFHKETGDTFDEAVRGALDGVKRWAAQNQATVQNSASESSDIPYPNSKRLHAEGKLANGAPFYSIQYLVVTDSIICNIGTYALSQPEVQAFTKFASSFKVVK